ncbi:hypothetical protein HDU76_001105 [Blyttiomyces sp. JEL0837]|nr:hypothetical protein HDU76_001105 [Blyttiomyces sp. JEL0837]
MNSSNGASNWSFKRTVHIPGHHALPPGISSQVAWELGYSRGNIDPLLGRRLTARDTLGNSINAIGNPAVVAATIANATGVGWLPQADSVGKNVVAAGVSSKATSNVGSVIGSGITLPPQQQQWPQHGGGAAAGPAVSKLDNNEGEGIAWPNLDTALPQGWANAAVASVVGNTANIPTLNTDNGDRGILVAADGTRMHVSSRRLRVPVGGWPSGIEFGMGVPFSFPHTGGSPQAVQGAVHCNMQQEIRKAESGQPVTLMEDYGIMADLDALREGLNIVDGQAEGGDEAKADEEEEDKEKEEVEGGERLNSSQAIAAEGESRRDSGISLSTPPNPSGPPAPPLPVIKAQNQTSKLEPIQARPGDNSRSQPKSIPAIHTPTSTPNDAPPNSKPARPKSAVVRLQPIYASCAQVITNPTAVFTTASGALLPDATPKGSAPAVVTPPQVVATAAPTPTANAQNITAQPTATTTTTSATQQTSQAPGAYQPPESRPNPHRVPAYAVDAHQYSPPGPPPAVPSVVVSNPAALPHPLAINRRFHSRPVHPAYLNQLRRECLTQESQYASEFSGVVQVPARYVAAYNAIQGVNNGHAVVAVPIAEQKSEGGTYPLHAPVTEASKAGVTGIGADHYSIIQHLPAFDPQHNTSQPHQQQHQLQQQQIRNYMSTNASNPSIISQLPTTAAITAAVGVIPTLPNVSHQTRSQSSLPYAAAGSKNSILMTTMPVTSAYNLQSTPHSVFNAASIIASSGSSGGGASTIPRSGSGGPPKHGAPSMLGPLQGSSKNLAAVDWHGFQAAVHGAGLNSAGAKGGVVGALPAGGLGAPVKMLDPELVAQQWMALLCAPGPVGRRGWSHVGRDHLSNFAHGISPVINYSYK